MRIFFSVGPQDLHYQAKAGEKTETKQAYSAMGANENREYNQVIQVHENPILNFNHPNLT